MPKQVRKGYKTYLDFDSSESKVLFIDGIIVSHS